MTAAARCGGCISRQPRGPIQSLSAAPADAFDVAVDLRRESPTFRRWVGIELSHDRRSALFVPADCAHGFLTSEDDCEVFYMVGDIYVPELARGVRWNDPAFAVGWPSIPSSRRNRTRAVRILIDHARAGRWSLELHRSPLFLRPMMEDAPINTAGFDTDTSSGWQAAARDKAPHSALLRIGKVRVRGSGVAAAAFPRVLYRKSSKSSVRRGP
jgi:hypothetical protein